MEHPLFIRKLDRSIVLGELKATGSKDIDVLEAARSRMLAPAKSLRIFGWGMVIVGALLALTIIGLALTIVFVPMGLWALGRAGHNIKVANAVFAEYALGGVG